MYQSLILALLATCACAYEVKNPDVSLRQDGGIKFATADEPEISLVAYHYSVNKPVPNVVAGDYNVDVNSPTDGYWVHENPSVVVVPGDIVNYWVHVITTSGTGHNLLEQSWTATAATQAPPTVATTTTVAATTSIVSPTTTLQTPVVTTIQSTASTGTTATTTQGSTTVTVPPGAGTLIFEDTFDTFDLDVWEHEMTAGGGGNWEFQYYTNNRSNSYVRDNTLYIKPTLTAEKEGEAFLTSGTLNLWGASPADLCTGNNWWGCERTGSHSNILNPIQSARLRTVNSFAFKHGRIEVFAQLPRGDWLWPAIWLLPKRNAYGGWPASGEIDLVESRGNLNLRAEDGTHVGAEQVGMTLHWGPYWPLNGYPMTHNAKNLPDGQTFGDGFHNYTLVWTADSLDFYLDGEPILSVDPGASGFFDYGGFEASNPGIQNPWANSPNKLAPFDQEFYIILNVAVGGTGYFSDSFTNTPKPKPWLNTSPTAAKDFYDAKADWYPTWNPDTNNGEDAAMKIKSVRVYAL